MSTRRPTLPEQPESPTAKDVRITRKWPQERLGTFHEDQTLGNGLNLIISVKNINLVKAENQHLNRPRKKMPRVIGVTEARPYHEGLLVALSISEKYNEEALSVENALWTLKYVEVHGVSLRENRFMAVSGGDIITVYDVETETKRVFRNPWFQHLHTVEFSSDGSRLLTASMGFDSIMEFEVASGRLTWDWNAWDQGFNRSLLGHYVVRSQKEAAEIIAKHKAAGEEIEVIVVDDPTEYAMFGLPTRWRPVGLNAVKYCDMTSTGDAIPLAGQPGLVAGDSTAVMATCFHTGDAWVISAPSGTCTTMIGGLFGPHGFSKTDKSHAVISSTRDGCFYIANESYEIEREVDLEGTPGVVRPEALGEWLQTTKHVTGSIYAGLDIHRSSLWLIDVDKAAYRRIPVPRGWALQDLFVMPEFWAEPRDFDAFKATDVAVE